jgi:hypothetical protein
MGLIGLIGFTASVLMFEICWFIVAAILPMLVLSV